MKLTNCNECGQNWWVLKHPEDYFIYMDETIYTFEASLNQFLWNFFIFLSPSLTAIWIWILNITTHLLSRSYLFTRHIFNMSTRIEYPTSNAQVGGPGGELGADAYHQEYSDAKCRTPQSTPEMEKLVVKWTLHEGLNTLTASDRLWWRHLESQPCYGLLSLRISINLIRWDAGGGEVRNTASRWGRVINKTSGPWGGGVTHKILSPWLPTPPLPDDWA